MHNGAPDEKWLQKNKFPSSLRMGTFRKFLFILYSRRPKSRLLVNQKKRGIIDQKILSSPLAVNGKIGFRNSLGFQAEIDDLRLKYRIVGGNLKIRSRKKPSEKGLRSSPATICPSVTLEEADDSLKASNKVEIVDSEMRKLIRLGWLGG